MPIFKAFLRVLCTVRFTVLGVFLIINSSFAVDCNDGYRTSCLPILDAQITNTTRTAYAAKPLDGSADQTDGDVTAETYGLSSAGEWGVSFEMGAFVGKSTCSAAHTEIVHQAGTPTGTPGYFCWCKATAFVPSDTEGMTCVSTTGPWISLGTINQSIDDCKSQCATKCTTLNPVSGVIAGKDSGFWDSLTEYDNDVCVPYTYKISYVMNDGQFPVIANVNNFYQITDDTISIPNPIDRVGYTFDGWCDNAELTQNCQINKTIPTGSYGNKTFYAKWNFVGCPEGYYYFYEVDHLSSLDTSVDGTSYGQNSISGTHNYSADYLTGRGTWATNFDYGRIYGAARCSSRSGNTHSNMWNGLVSDWFASDEVLNAASSGYHCWCSATDFLPLNGTKQTISPKSWIYLYTPNTTINTFSECQNGCSASCATVLKNNSKFRSAMYGGECRATTYSITYMDGETARADLGPQSYTAETAVTLPTPIKFGYSFDGWYNNPSFLGDAFTKIDAGSRTNRTFYAKWRPKYYTITYKDGENQLDNIEPILTPSSNEETISLPSLEDRDGLTFIGWCDDAELTNNCSITKTVSADTPITVYAKWGCPQHYHLTENNICEPVTYYAIFKDGDNVINQVGHNILSETPITSTVPSKDGYVFIGWCNTVEQVENLTVQCPTSVTVPTNVLEDKTFYAKWLQNTCSTDNTTANNLISLVNVETRGSESAALDDGRCVFPGYNGVGSETSGPCQNLISTYNFNHGDWFVIFDYGKLQGRGICSNTTGNIGATADTVTETSNGSYCWCNITKFTPTNGITRETTSPWFSVGSQSGCSTNCAQTCGAGTFKNHNNFYNVVKPAYYLTNVCNAPVYTIHYNSNYGTEYEDQQYTAIYDTITLPTPTRAGYDFDGWYDNANFEGEPVTQVVSGSIGNKTFWAKWNFIGCSTGYIEQETNGVKTCILIKHSITYIDEDTELDLEPSTYDITTLGTNLPSAPQGYTNFIGWCLDSSTCFSTIDKIPNNWTGNKVLYLKKCPENYKLGTPFSVNERATKWAAKSALTGDAASASAYGLTAHGEWGATFDSGYIVGTSLCSQTSGSAVGAVGQPDETGEGDTKYCWCKVTKYGFPEREVNSTKWVAMNIATANVTAEYCNGWCAYSCAQTAAVLASSTPRVNMVTMCIPDFEQTINYVLNDENAVFPATAIKVPHSYISSDLPISLENAIPVRPYYTFDGWYDNANFEGTAITEILSGTNQDITLYAKWSWTGCQDGSYLDSSTNTCETCPDGYISNGKTATSKNDCYVEWNCSENLAGCPQNATCTYIDPDHLSGIDYYGDTALHCEIDATCNTGYESNNGLCTAIEYDIQYVIPGGDFLNTLNQNSIPRTYTVSSVIDLSSIVADRPGYEFTGWYDNSTFEGSAIAYLPDNKGLRNVTLYAKFEPVVCTVIYDNEGDVSRETYSGQSTITLPVVNKNSYTFNGWCEEDLNTCPGGPKQTLTARNGTVNLYAKYTKTVCEDGQYLKGDTCVSCPRDYPYSNGATAVNETQCYREWSCDEPPTCPENSISCSYAYGTSGIEYYTLAVPRCKTTFTCKPGYTPRNNLLKGIETFEGNIQEVSTNFYGSWRAGNVNPNNILPGYLEHASLGKFSPTISSSLPASSWLTRFSYGTVVGHSLCSAKQGASYRDYQWNTNNAGITATVAELNAAGEGQYCWCQATGFSPEFDTSQNFSDLENMASPWLMIKDLGNNADCKNYCSDRCSRMGEADSSQFRMALYDSFTTSQFTSATTDNENQTWSVTTPYGTISGESSCSSIRQHEYDLYGGPRYYTGNPDAGTLGSTCWCKATEFIPNNNSYKGFLDNVWHISSGVPTRTEYCISNCASLCVRTIDDYFERITSSSRHFQIYQEDQACVPEQYIIRYENVNMDDVTWPEDPVKPSVYDALTDTFAISTPNRTNYSFYGWCSTAEEAQDPESDCPFYVNIEKGSAGDKTFYAKWGAKRYTVAYMNGNNLILPPLEPHSYIESDLPVNLPTTAPNADENLVFSGWYNNSGFVGDAFEQIPTGSHTNRTFYAKWRPKYYDITYMDGNNEINDIEPILTISDKPETVSLPTLPESEGMAFVGWCDNAELTQNCSTTKTISADTKLTVYALWEKARYTITYIDDISNAPIDNIDSALQSYTIDDTVVLPTEIEKEYYNFDELLDEQNAHITEIPSGSTGNRTLRASFTPNNYTISFVPNAVSTNVPDSIEYTVESLPELPEPTDVKPGYAFVGYLDVDTGEDVSEITIENIGNKTLTPNYSYTACGDGYETQISDKAIWDTSTNGSNYYYTNNDGSHSKLLGSTPLPNGNWQTVFANTKNLYGKASCNNIPGELPPETMLASTETQNAQRLGVTTAGQYCWCLLDSYNLTNNSSSKVTLADSNWVYLGDLNSNTTCLQGTSQSGATSCASRCAKAAKENMRFRAQLLGEYAICAVALYDIIPELNGGTFGGQTVPDKTSMFYHAITLPTPSRTGYTFAGWCDDAELNLNCEINKTIPEGTSTDVYVYAKWTPIDYLITYNLDDGILPDGVSNPAVYHIDDTLELPIPSRDRYVFDGWYECDDYNCNSVSVWGPGETDANKQFWAKWNFAHYTITYDLRGGHFDNNESSEQDYTVESNSVILKTPTKFGYTFDGWCVNAETCEEPVRSEQNGWTGDKQLVAQWSLDNYAIEYHNVDNVTWEEDDVVYNYNVTDDYPINLPRPLKPAHHFENWYQTIDLDASQDAPNPISEIVFGTTGDKDFYAKWSCLAGNYTNGNNSCAVCPTGSYSTIQNASGCVLCADGQTSADGSTTCEACPNTNNGIDEWMPMAWENGDENTTVLNRCEIRNCKTGYEKTTMLNTSINGFKSYAVGKNIQNSQRTCWMSRSSDSCSNSIYSDLNLNKWKTQFSYGWVYGSSRCSAKKPDGWQALQQDSYTNTSNWMATQTELDNTGQGKYCWCKIDSFAPLGSNEQSVFDDSNWVHTSDLESTQNCDNSCSAWCASRLEYLDYYRTAIFGVTFDEDVINNNSAENTVCTLERYDITYVGVEESDWPENDAKKPGFYTVEDTTLEISNLSREGYVFMGWCRDNENCQNPQTDLEISVDSANLTAITLYSKWECSAGYYNNSGVCLPCAVGTFSATQNANSCSVCETPGRTTFGEHATSCDANCSNSENVTEWLTPSWDFATNTTENLCRISECDTGYTIESSTVTEVSTSENGIHAYCSLQDAQNTRCYKDWHLTNCSDEVFDGIDKPMGWRVVFRHGTVTGTSVCSTTSAPDYKYSDTSTYTVDSPDTTTEGGYYCWCKATGYAVAGGANQEVSSAWVFAIDDRTSLTCKNSCANNCANRVYANQYFRSVMFGHTPINGTTLDNLVLETPVIGNMCTPITYDIHYHNVDNVVWGSEKHPDFYTTLQDEVVIGRPSRTGFVFMGWCETDSCAEPALDYSFNAGNHEADVDLYAQWTCAAGYYKNGSACSACPQDPYGIQYTSPNENTDGINSCYYLCEDVYEALCPPEHSNSCNYNGDATDKNMYGYETNNCLISFNCDAGYDKDGNSCTLHTYHISYIDTIDDSSVIEDYTVEQLPIEKTVSTTNAHTGRTFMGWCENETDINNTEATCSDTITVNEVGDKTFYSRWDVNTYDIKYYNVEGTNLSADTYTYGFGKALSTPEKEGFKFIRWCDYDTITQEVSNCGRTSISTEETGNKYLYAQWGCVAGYYGDGTTCEQCPTETHPNSVEDDNATLEKCFAECPAVESCPQSNVKVCHNTDYNEYYNADSTEACSSGVVCNDYYELNNGDCVATEYTVTFMDGDTQLHQESYTVETGTLDITQTPENNDATRAFYQWCEKENDEYINCVNDTTVTVNTTTPRNIIFYVKWTCDNGYYSADGTCTQCPVGYRNTDTGADKIADCYNKYTCPTTCPPHSTSCTQPTKEFVKNYYGATEFESCDMDVTCEDGYEVKTRTNIHGSSQDDNYSAIEKLLNGQVYQKVEKITDFLSVTYTDQPVVVGDGSGLSNGQSEWNMEYGTLRYESTCDTASGSDSTINGEDGRYCWCKMTQYSADGNNFIDMDMPWYYELSAVGDATDNETCRESCICSPFQSISHLSWFGEDKVCVAKTYYILFDSRGGYMLTNRKRYDITTEPFYLPKPSRPGYAFAGWCETLADAENNNSNCSADVLITPSGSAPAEKWYYAKWIPFVCDEDKIVATKFDTTKDMLNYSTIEIDGRSRATTGTSPGNYNLTQSGTWTTEYDYGTIYGEAVCKDMHYSSGMSTFANDVLNTIPDSYADDIDDVNSHLGTCFCKITGFKSKFADTLQDISDSYWHLVAAPPAYTCRRDCAYYCTGKAKDLFAENANTNYCAYRIDYHLNNGEFVAPALHPNHYDTGDRFTIGQPVRRGYTFAGWCVGQDRCNNTQKSFEVNSSTVGAVDLYAQWTAGQYTITYNMMGGTPTYQPEQNTVGIMVYFPDDPTREGYDFAGWCPNSETCENPIKTQTWGGTTEDITMYAQWDIKTYYITYVFNNGDASVTEEQDFNEQVILRKPTKSGFTFDGYCVDTTNCNPLTLPVDNTSASWVHSAWNRDLTLYAKWTQNASTEECTSKAWLHVGEDKACLSKTPVEKPALVIQGKHGKYYLKATKDSNLPMSRDTTKQLRIQKANDIYNIHDETVSGNSGGSSETNKCDLSKLDKSLNGINYTQNSDGSWATTFSYGVIGGNAMCGARCVGNKSVLNGVPDGAGSCCYCQITSYKPQNEDTCLTSSAPWVQSMRLSSCTPYNCASTCSSLVKDWTGLRNSMYNE